MTTRRSSFIDLTDFVATQRAHLTDPSFASLEMPVERVYVPRSVHARERIGLQTAIAPPDRER
jgi:hypothetical protein